MNLKYEEGTSSISSHFSQMQSIINQLSSMEVVLDDELQALLLLSSLPDNYCVRLVESLNDISSSEKLSMNEVKNSLLNEELMRMALGSLALESDVLVTKNVGSNSKGNNNCSESGRKSRREIQCYY